MLQSDSLRAIDMDVGILHLSTYTNCMFDASCSPQDKHSFVSIRSEQQGGRKQATGLYLIPRGVLLDPDGDRGSVHIRYRREAVQQIGSPTSGPSAQGTQKEKRHSRRIDCTQLGHSSCLSSFARPIPARQTESPRMDYFCFLFSV